MVQRRRADLAFARCNLRRPGAAARRTARRQEPDSSNGPGRRGFTSRQGQRGPADPGDAAAAASLPARPEAPGLRAARAARPRWARRQACARPSRLSPYPAARRRPAAVLHHQAARSAAALADVGELVIDKLPTTPSRLDPPGLTGRVVSASLAAAILARSRSGPDPGHGGRLGVCAGRGQDMPRCRPRLPAPPDPAVAVAEDALAIGLRGPGQLIRFSRGTRQALPLELAWRDRPTWRALHEPAAAATGWRAPA